MYAATSRIDTVVVQCLYKDPCHPQIDTHGSLRHSPKLRETIATPSQHHRNTQYLKRDLTLEIYKTRGVRNFQRVRSYSIDVYLIKLYEFCYIYLNRVNYCICFLFYLFVFISAYYTS